MGICRNTAEFIENALDLSEHYDPVSQSVPDKAGLHLVGTLCCQLWHPGSTGTSGRRGSRQCWGPDRREPPAEVVRLGGLGAGFHTVT